MKDITYGHEITEESIPAKLKREENQCHKDYVDGYMDGRDKNSPEPNDNRSERYKHSFNVGRAELDNKPIPYSVSMSHVITVEEEEENR